MKKYKLITINGESWCRNLTGIERLAIEVTKALDDMFLPGQAELVVPKNAINLPELKNIKIVTLDVEANFFPKWNQVTYQKYVRKNNALSLDFSNTCPYFAPGAAFIHDLYFKLYEQDVHSLRDRLVKLYSDIMYKTIARKAPVVFTVSEYTKKTIVDVYKVNPDRIKVVYSGVGEYKNIPFDDGIFERLPELNDKEFYFTLGSLSTRKNLKWIADHAELYPNETFVISGKALKNIVPPELEKLKTLSNVIMTGYLSDSEVKSILKKAKAFVLPSYFEGFGLPPLEALSCGTQIIVSNVTSLPEIYGKCAHYIDPNNPNVSLDDLLKEQVESPEKILEKFTLVNTAKRIFECIKDFI